MTFKIRALVDGVDRRFALHRATLVELAARAVPGTDTAATAKTRIADRSDVAAMAASDE
jgi:hypothetical protein